MCFLCGYQRVCISLEQMLMMLYNAEDWCRCQKALYVWQQVFGCGESPGQILK